MSTSPTLLRSLGLRDATLLVVGCIIGVGIFRTPASIAGVLPSPALMLGLWVCGGLVSMCGAFCYAELAAMFPASGGDYVYLTRIYGRFWGFLFGWTKLFIERTGTIGILGFVFAEYLGRLIPSQPHTMRWIASAAICGLTAANVAGIRWGTLIQNLFTTLKLGALAAIIFAGVTALLGEASVSTDWTVSLAGTSLGSAGVAFVFVLWTFGGWTESTYVADEVRDPTRTIPHSIVLGILLVTLLYVLVNWSYLFVVPLDRLADTPLVASAVMEYVFGPSGAIFIAAMVACSAFGALNGYVLTGARILFAIGRDHALFAKMGAVHPTFHTPALALWVNAGIACALVLTKTLDEIMIYSTVTISLFFIMTVFGTIILRRRDPSAKRPYRAWGYPVTPIVFCLVMIAFVLDICLKEPRQMAFGGLLLAAGVPLYWLSNRAGSRQQSAQGNEQP